jgi:hypothetical protein
LNVTNNGGWGLKTGYASNGYNVNLSGAPDSGSGIWADPQFVDPTRNFAKWAYARAYSVSASPLQRVADGLTALQADPGRIADLMGYVRGGFSPQNTVYRHAGHDGGDIGAIAAPGQTLRRGPRHTVVQ